MQLPLAGDIRVEKLLGSEGTFKCYLRMAVGILWLCSALDLRRSVATEGTVAASATT